jgi:hypothetical protein
MGLGKTRSLDILSLLLTGVLVFLMVDMAQAQQDRRITRVKERRVALVIGNGSYKGSPLRNPVNDARDMASVLRDLGFSVIEQINADKREMVSAIDKFYQNLRGAKVGLFYFAGHGMQIQGANYLVPVGTRVSSQSDVQFEAVNAGRVLGKMHDAGNKLNIVILDACRDNPFKRSFRTGRAGLAQMDAPKGTIIAYATAPGSVAADGTGRNGIYTKHLLMNIKRSDLSVQDVFRETGLGVMGATGEKQVPWTSATPVPAYCLARGFIAMGRPSDSAALEEERVRLEAERERLAEERRRLEEAKKQQVASLPPKPSISKPKVILRDRHFEKYDNGVVKDTRTGLEWVAGPDRNMTWSESWEWVHALRIAGGGWRMPTLDELEAIHEKGEGNRNMTPLLSTTGWWVWSEKTSDSSSKWGYTFYCGGRYWCARSYPDRGRAFAVRSSR